jgi:hypothetical protein
VECSSRKYQTLPCLDATVEQKYVAEADITTLVLSISDACREHLHHVLPAVDRLLDTERPVRAAGWHP